MLTLFSAIRNRRRRRNNNATSTQYYEDKIANMKPCVRTQLSNDILQTMTAMSNPTSRPSMDHDQVNASRQQEQEQEQQQQQDDDGNTMNDLESCIQQAEKMLQVAMEREEFVRMRLRRYQEILQQQAKELEIVNESSLETDSNMTPTSVVSCYIRVKEQEDNESVKEDVAAVAVAADDDDDDDDYSDDDDDNKEALVEKMNAKTNDEEVGVRVPQLSPEERERRLTKLQQDRGALQKVEQDFEKLKEHTNFLKRRVFTLERKRDEIIQKTAECQAFLLAAALVEGREETCMEEEEENTNIDPIPHAAAESPVTMRAADVDIGIGHDQDGDSDNDNYELVEYTMTARNLNRKDCEGSDEGCIIKSAE